MSDIDDLASGSCVDEECGAKITLAHVMEEYVPRYNPKDEDEEAYYCSACEHADQSATILGGRYFCFWCKVWFDCTEQCESCVSDLVGFDSIESVFSSCFMCDAAIAERFAKD